VAFIVRFLVSSQKLHMTPCNAILVIVDWYTKQVHYFLCHDTLNMFEPASFLTKKLMLQGAGIPQSVVLDHGPQFTSMFWAAFFHYLHINQCLNTAFHQKLDGQTECQKHTFKQYLSTYVKQLQDD
jgi:hypothetical protein